MKQHGSRMPDDKDKAGRVEESEEEDDGDGSSDEEGDEEPRLKYTPLTRSLTSLYRNADATSASLVTGDKMV